MKKLPIALFAISTIVAAVAGPSLAVPNQVIGIAAVSLGGIGKTGPLKILGDAREWFRHASPTIAPAKKFISAMPIVSPKADIDPKMVKIADSTTDYKLIVKAPGIESAK